MSNLSTPELFQEYVLPNYGRFPVTFVRGEGSRIWDEEGKEYLDFGAGIAVCAIGHCHEAITSAITAQASKLIHASNLYRIREQGELAQHITERVVGERGKVFFCNSGAEANETLIKLARKFGGGSRYEVITFDSCFHGRTFAGISATAQPKVKAGFEPLLDGFRHLPFNDLLTLKSSISPKTAAILLEPVQGEGGIVAAKPQFLRGIAELCREHDLLFMLDEVQCGVGRLGQPAGWKAILDDPDVFPDAISWAKGIGGGLPCGAVWVRNRPAKDDLALCDVLGPGTHGSTFGGNPLVSATALAVLKEIDSKRLWEHAAAMGTHICEAIEAWEEPRIAEVRGLGLMLGIALNEAKFEVPEGKTASIYVVTKLMEAGLLTVPAGPKVVRLLPALNVSEAEIDRALEILKTTIESL